MKTKQELHATQWRWPVGMGPRFKGVYSLYEKNLILFTPHGKQEDEDYFKITDLKDELLANKVGTAAANELRDEINTIVSVYPDFTREDYLNGDICPVFFGSAVNNFGVRELLDCFVEIAPNPLKRETEERIVLPEENKFTGFVFKIHSNMDPQHRDRIAFLRICSGKFERNTNYQEVNAAYAKRFPGVAPARATVQVSALPRGARVEIDAIAVRP